VEAVIARFTRSQTIKVAPSFWFLRPAMSATLFLPKNALKPRPKLPLLSRIAVTTATNCAILSKNAVASLLSRPRKIGKCSIVTTRLFIKPATASNASSAASKTSAVSPLATTVSPIPLWLPSFWLPSLLSGYDL